MNLPQQDTINQYLSDGIATTYIYSYLILLDTDIQVYVTPAGQPPNPINDLKVLGVDYTVTGMGMETGGNVVFINIPALGDIVTLSRNILISIDTSFYLAQNFNGANLDSAFERVTLFTQQTNTILNERALQYEINTYLPNSTSNIVPALGNGQVWSGLNGTVVATTIESNPNISLLRSQLASQTPLAEGSLLIGYYDTVATNGITLGQYLDYKDVFGFDSGIADALILSISNSNFIYANGQTIHVIVANTNLTTTPTININGLGSILIKRNPTSATQPGDLTAGSVVDLIYSSSGNAFYITNLFIPTVSSSTPTVTILNSGSGTYNLPAGCTWIWVEGVGPGGGSGSALTPGSTSSGNATGGGGGGGYFEKTIRTPTSSYSYNVGVQGLAGTSGGNGTTGTATTFGTMTGNPGEFSSGISSLGVFSFYLGGNGGSASGGDRNISGNSGGTGIQSGRVCLGGDGGNSFISSRAKSVATNISIVAGNAGLNYGGGASGAVASTTGGNSANGANGDNGFIQIIEFYV